MSSRCDKKHLKPANNAARERSRVQSLRAAFLDLQRSLPSVPPDTKLSKLDVLVLATGYIYHLTQTLEEGYNDDQIKAQASAKHTTFNTTTSDDHGSSSPTTIQTPASSSLYPTEIKSSNPVYIGGTVAPELDRKIPKERFYSNLISNLSHKAVSESSSHSSGADRRLSSNLRVMQWNIPRPKRETRPRLLTNQSGSIGILHPVKKWPMRCRLYNKILGHEPVPSTIQAWRKEQRGSL